MGSGTRVADVPALPPALDVTGRQPAGAAPLPIVGTGSTAALGTGSHATGGMAPLTPSPPTMATTGGRGTGTVGTTSERYTSSVSPPSALAVGGGHHHHLGVGRTEMGGTGVTRTAGVTSGVTRMSETSGEGGVAAASAVHIRCDAQCVCLLYTWCVCAHGTWWFSLR